MPIKKRILVVDDDMEMGMIIKSLLTEHHYDVEIALNGLEAIQKSNETFVDLILLDIRMPYFSGLWFCEAFRQRPQTKNIPVVIISGISDEEEIKKAYQRGASAFVKKPFTSEELLRAVEDHLQSCGNS